MSVGDEDRAINNAVLGCRLCVCLRGGGCCFKWRFPSRSLTVWPRELRAFISLGAESLQIETERGEASENNIRWRDSVDKKEKNTIFSLFSDFFSSFLFLWMFSFFSFFYSALCACFLLKRGKKKEDKTLKKNQQNNKTQSKEKNKIIITN